MTKADIAKIVHERVGLTKKESAQIVESVLDVIRDSLEQGDNVKLSGFGHFIVRQKHARRGRNPKTGTDIIIAPRSVVTFRASPLLKNKLTGVADK
jgi:integration host factor subunit alpha